jgi:hypothetical protein
VLVDFLVGESVATLARKHHVRAGDVEDAIRAALARYNFAAASGSTIGKRPRGSG